MSCIKSVDKVHRKNNFFSKIQKFEMIKFVELGDRE